VGGKDSEKIKEMAGKDVVRSHPVQCRANDKAGKDTSRVGRGADVTAGKANGRRSRTWSRRSSAAELLVLCSGAAAGADRD
jgi:hypothetical protein